MKNDTDDASAFVARWLHETLEGLDSRFVGLNDRLTFYFAIVLALIGFPDLRQQLAVMALALLTVIALIRLALGAANWFTPFGRLAAEARDQRDQELAEAVSALVGARPGYDSR